PALDPPPISMSTRFRRSAHEYELLPRASSESHEFPGAVSHASDSSWLGRQAGKLAGVTQLFNPSVYVRYVTPRRRKRSILRLAYWTAFSAPCICLLLVLAAGICFPSYTHRPAHYNELRERSLHSTTPGRANPRNEKIFIAASLYEKDGELTSGAWGRLILELVDLLGPQNVHLSVYENDADPLTQQSLIKFEKELTCNSSITFEDLDLSTLPRVTLPTGETRLKRIAFLAEVRNRALAPIDSTGQRFDRVLYINDVVFDPIDAAQLLLSTNVDATGRTSYGAACAVDFINAFKFYDRFATRDHDGYNMGVPWYPWFTNAGTATSRKDVLAGSDAVRVRACWGGMTAFEAKWFQDQAPFETDSSSDSSTSNLSPLRFRYEEDTFWESSECCLIHGDLQYRRTGLGMPPDSGIYMNPYVRVAYDTKSLSWLSLTRRPERLFTWAHYIVNRIAGFPVFNPRQTEEPGQTVIDTIWEYDDPGTAFSDHATNEEFKGHYRKVQRVAKPGGFCGGRNLLVINEKPEQGQGPWGKIDPPRPPVR
ncbi:cryptococcal mannosyltransferase 1-domain-containing protein, partial [Massariosphaeria phaeospora]